MINSNELLIVTESSTTIKYPVTDKYLKYDPSRKSLTDISIFIINHITSSPTFFQPLRSLPTSKRHKTSINLLNLFTGNGLKLIRYAQEIHNVDNITSIDQSLNSFDLTTQNIHFNKFQCHQPELIQSPVHTYLQQQTKPFFQIIELDPIKKNCPELYSSIITLLAIPTGLVILSIPELGLISGNAYHGRCFEVYGGQKLGKHSATVEGGVRLVMKRFELECMALGRNCELLITVVEPSLIKLFIKVSYNINDEISSLQDKAKEEDEEEEEDFYYYCPRCDYIIESNSPNTDKCDTCTDTKLVKSGKFYLGSLKNNNFISMLLLNAKNPRFDDEADPCDEEMMQSIKSKLIAIADECDKPFYITPNKRARSGNSKPLRQIISQIELKGYIASMTQFGNSYLKTNCPWPILDDVLKL